MRIKNSLYQCPKCLSDNLTISDTRINCLKCNNVYPVTDGIPDFRLDSEFDTFLDISEYDELKQQTNENKLNTYKTVWEKIMTDSLDFNSNIKRSLMEIGCGSGNLTYGLVHGELFETIYSGDISRSFIDITLKRQPESKTKVKMVQYDANYLPFVPEAFDCIVGSSVLHHFINYDKTIVQCFNLLKKNGLAIFGEPVLDGVVFLSLYAGLIIEIHSHEKEEKISKSELKKLKIIYELIERKSKSMQDLDKLKLQEDKWMYRIADMQKLSDKIGFKKMEFKKVGDFNPKFQSIELIVNNFFIKQGISTETLNKYSYLLELFNRTFGSLNHQSFSSQFGFFVFIK